jgi:hypothetical protein
MLDYNQMKLKVFASGVAPDGYFGDTRPVTFALHNGYIMQVADCGYCQSGLPRVIGEREALWILKHHPRANHYKDIQEVPA